MDGVWNFYGDIKFRCNYFVSLIDLIVVRNEFGINCSLGGFDCCVEFVCNFFKKNKVVIWLYIVFIGYYDFCCGEFGLIGFCKFFGYESWKIGVFYCIYIFDSCWFVFFSGFECSCLNCDNFFWIVWLYCLYCVVSINWLYKSISRLNFNDIGNLYDI